MIISVKDGFKLVGITIVCFCAVFVCTFFMNYYLDVLPLEETVAAELMPLYKAQLATARMTCAVTGGFLAAVAVVMLFFYVKLYIDDHRKTIGIFKAMGYSASRIAREFSVFGLSVAVGTSAGFGLGWACMRAIYGSLTIDGMPEVVPTFHVSLLILCVIVPTLVFSAAAYLYTLVKLGKPALKIMRGEDVEKAVKASKGSRPFLVEMCLSTLRRKKLLVFFAAFSCFCFSAMVQMGLSMENLVDGTMGFLILIIGLVLAVVSVLMSMTALVKSNTKNIAVMKAMGYNKKERFAAIFAGSIPFALIGFAVGTVYQFGLLSLMVNVIFKDVGEMPSYSFDVPVFFITLALFVAAYAGIFMFFLHKANGVSVKEAILADS